MQDIYYNGIIHVKKCMDVQALAVEKGRITRIGTNEESKTWKEGAETRFHDLQGCFVSAGFNDSHMHLLEYGRCLSMADLSSGTRSLSRMLQKLKEYGEELKRKELKQKELKNEELEKQSWILGRGWNHDYFQDEKRFPNRYDLDKVSKEYPVFIYRACGHIACANTAALMAAGISAATKQPEGGSFDTDENGEPTGIFREYGIDLVSLGIPKPDKEEIKGCIIKAMKKLNSYGITSVQTDDFCAFPGVGYETVLEAYYELESENKLTLKVYEQCLLPNLSILKDFLLKGYYTGKGSRYFCIGPLKLIADGSLGARTALLSQPYGDDKENPKNRGVAIYTQEELDQLIACASGHGMQTAIHAIGDQAMKMAVHAIEKALGDSGENLLRHGIVHCQITTKELLEDFKRLGLFAYIQTIFLDYDIHIVEKRVGKLRAGFTYQFKSLMDMGAKVSNGSDCPVELPDVLAGIQCAVTRTTLDGTKAFLKNQAFTVEEALETYTLSGARASFEEREKGELLPGMAADFVVLLKDLRTCPLEEIKDIPVLKTYVNGVCVYNRK